MSETNGSMDEARKQLRALYGENRQIMVFDEFDIHPEKESDRKIVDWEKTYSLTRYYCV